MMLWTKKRLYWKIFKATKITKDTEAAINVIQNKMAEWTAYRTSSSKQTVYRR